jgi:hypothetical protein
MSSELAPSPKPSRFRFALDILKSVREYAQYIKLVGTALVVAVTAKAVVFDRTFKIGDFTIPAAEAQHGPTSAAIGRMLIERISEIQRGAKAAVAERQLGVQAFESVDAVAKIADPKFGAVGSVAASYVRGWLGIEQTLIVGDLFVESQDSETKKYVLHAYVRGEENWCEDASGPSLKKAVEKLGTCIVERLDPLSAGFYYLHNATSLDKTLQRTLELADRFQSKDEKQSIWALLLRGMAWRDKTGHAADVRANLCEVIARDPSFTPAWRILANSLRADGAYGYAEDLGLRLVHLRPDEAEGYRQLGSLRVECMADEKQEAEARRFFEHVIALAGHESKDYLTHVDYARWLYSHYEPGKRYVPAETEGTVPQKADYLEAAAAYLDKASQLAPDQESIYTNWARVLGYPRPGVQYDKAEMKLKHVLNQMDGREKTSYPPFAGFVMGELLTDEAVERHQYKAGDVEKFKKAQSYLATVTRAASWGEAQYEALYARGLGGEGKYDAALQQVARFKNPRNQYYFLVEWVRGEILYNQSLQTRDKTLLTTALQHLNSSRNLRSCGARADAVRDLIRIVETELEKKPADLQAGPSDRPDGLIEMRTKGDGKVKLESEMANPAQEGTKTEDPAGVRPTPDAAKPEQGAMLAAPEAVKPQLVAVKIETPEPVVAKPDLMDSKSNLGAAKPDAATGPNSAPASRLEPMPLCPGWEKLTGEKLSPWPAPDAAAAAFIPSFDAAH